MIFAERRYKTLNKKLKVQDKLITEKNNKLNRRNKFIKTLQKDLKRGVVFDPVKHSVGKIDIQSWIRRIRRHWNKSKVILVNMQNANNTYTFLIVFASGQSFTYKDGTYMIDTKFFYPIPHLGLQGCDYHESLSIPFRRGINVEKVKKEIVNSDEDDIELALSPSLIKRVMKSHVIEKMMAGHELDKIFKKLIVLGVISVVALLIVLALTLHSGGYIDAIQGMV